MLLGILTLLLSNFPSLLIVNVKLERFLQWWENTGSALVPHVIANWLLHRRLLILLILLLLLHFLGSFDDGLVQG